MSLLLMQSFKKVFVSVLTLIFLASCGGQKEENTPASVKLLAEQGQVESNSGIARTLVTASTLAEPQTGWYWNPAEGGRGYAIERQGNQLFLTAFLYEVTGEATWYVSSLTVQSDGHYSGELSRYSGGQTLLGAYKTAVSAKFADISLSFSTETGGILKVVPLVGLETSITIQRFPFSTPTSFAPTEASFESGWWWNPAEGGRGYFIETQGSQAFIGSFMYGTDGQPTWYVSSANLLGPIGVSGPLDQYSGGQSLLGSFKSATKSSTSAGVMSFHLTSGNTGNLVLPNGEVVPLTRFVFNSVAPTGATSSLKISEVSTAYYGDDIAWFEVYNPNSVPVPLSDYSLRTGSIDAKTYISSTTPVIFSLPHLEVPAKGYVVIGGKAASKISDNSQMVLVNSDINLPFWKANGAIELLRASQTVDFVRFGTSTTEPLTAGAWIGGNVAALPSGPNEHGKSIVRLASTLMIDTNGASDWTQVNFSTPAGSNDILAGVTDSDHDGVPDSAKIQGNTYAGLDLYAMGARPGQRDVFIQIDHVKNADPATLPRKEALQKLVDTFASKIFLFDKKMVLHIDAGSLYSASFDPAAFNLGGGKEFVSSPCIQIPYGTTILNAGCTSIYDYKSVGFDIRRKLLFHYILFGTSQMADGTCDSSGIGDVGGNNVLVTLAGCGHATTAGKDFNILVNFQAATLMHELGHNFGLQHGGNEKNNYKPNYYSIMNYLYSFPGLSAAPNGIHAADRYYYKTESSPKYASTQLCDLDYSPCTTNFIMDYSHGSSIDLDETQLSEAKNIGRGSIDGAFADWDNNNSPSSGLIASDIHQGNETTSLRVLKDYDDWSNLVLPFTRSGTYGIGSNTSPIRGRNMARKNFMNDRAHNIIREDPMSTKHREGLRSKQPLSSVKTP